jgi:hypothetical protein
LSYFPLSEKARANSLEELRSRVNIFETLNKPGTDDFYKLQQWYYDVKLLQDEILSLRAMIEKLRTPTGMRA